MPEQKVFVSYSRLNSKFVLKLVKGLKDSGVNIWLDQIDIPIGVEWDMEVEKALKTYNYLLFIASKESVSSENVLNEVYYALDKKKEYYQ